MAEISDDGGGGGGQRCQASLTFRWYSRMMTGTEVGGIMPTSVISIVTYSGGVKSYCMFSRLRGGMNS